MEIGVKKYPRAYQAAAAITWGCSFPLNISALLENISSHRIYDVSSRTYNSTLAQTEGEKLYPQKAWTIFEEQLDTYLIVWNAAQSVPSIRYSVAHELGHILLNHQRAWPADPVLMKRQKEAEANVFANCLLAPFDAIHKLCAGAPYHPRQIAAYFGIPLGAAKMLEHDYAYWLLALKP